MRRKNIIIAATLLGLVLPALAHATTERLNRRHQRTQMTAHTPTVCPVGTPSGSVCELRTRFRADEDRKQGTNPARRGTKLRWSIQQYLCVNGICSTLVLADRGVAPRHSLSGNSTRRFETKTLYGSHGSYQYSYVTVGKVHYRDHKKTSTGPVPPCIVNSTTYSSGWGTRGTGTVVVNPYVGPSNTASGPASNIRVARTRVTQLEPNCP